MVKIISDSTCDLSQELIEKYDVSILPLHILMGDAEYEDGVEVKPDDIFAWADANKTTPKTSAPSMEHTLELFETYLSKNSELVCFSISESMSASNNVMRMAAEELHAEDRVIVIDSANLSTGIALLVVEAAIMAQNGASAKEIADRMEELKPLVRSSFVVDTLTYLHRGGRCSGVAAFAGSALKLHPKISVVNGAMEAGKKYRGNIEKVIMTYVKDMEADLKNAKKDRVFITHSDCRQEIIDQVKEYLSSLNVFDEIHVTRTGGVIASHCGPGTLGVLFIAN